MVQYSSEKYPPVTQDKHFITPQIFPMQMDPTDHFWWGASGGTEEIFATVSYYDNQNNTATSASAPIYVSVVFPNSGATITPSNPSILPSPDRLVTGIAWQPWVNSNLDDPGNTFVNYQVAYVQMITQGDFTRQTTNPSDPVQRVLITTNPTRSVLPLLDVPRDGSPFYPYYQASGTGEYTYYDQPFAQLDTSDPNYPTKTFNYYNINLSFDDMLMYRPLSPGGGTPDGIWVPLGPFGWQVQATAENNSTPPSWTIDLMAQPYTPVINGDVSNPPDAIAVTTNPGPAWPGWNDIAGTYVQPGAPLDWKDAP